MSMRFRPFRSGRVNILKSCDHFSQIVYTMYAALLEGGIKYALIARQGSRMKFCYLLARRTSVSLERDNRFFS